MVPALWQPGHPRAGRWASYAALNWVRPQKYNALMLMLVLRALARQRFASWGTERKELHVVPGARWASGDKVRG